MSTNVRWGLISTAKINNALIGPIKQAQRSELAAVASRDLAKAQTYAQEKGIPKAFGSYKALLADPDIDAVYISLPNTLHCEWTVKAAEAGKHVLCEKPLVTTLDEMDKVETAAQANGVTVVEAFMYLHHPQTLKVQAMIEAGQLGNIQLVNSWFNFYLPPERSENIRLNPTLAGGSTWDVGVYPNSMALTMIGAGAPEEVWAQQLTGETGVEVALRGQMRFANGAVAQTSSGFRTPFREATYVVGDKGTVNIIQPWKPGLTGDDSQVIFSTIDGQEETITFPAVDPYLCEVESFEACLLDGAAPVISLEQSRNFLRTVLALYQSAKTGRLVQP